MKARISEILESFREFVTTHDYQETPVLTAYVGIDSTDPDNRRDRPAWLIELKNEAKKLESGLDQEQLKRRATQNKWANTEEMVMKHLEDRKPTGRSVVMFTDHADFVDVDLPVTVPTRLYYGLPQVKHMLFALDQYKKYLVVLLSGSEVRALEVFLTRTTDELRIETDHELARRLGRTANAHKRESRADEFERRFTRAVAKEINDYFMGDPDFERMIFGGNLKQAHAVRNSLHPSVREMLVAIEPMEFKLHENDVAKQVKAIADQYEQDHDMAAVEGLLACSNRGLAVVERQGVQQALARGNVKTLVIPYPMESGEFDALIVEATAGGAEIEFVYDEAAGKLKEFGGIGAKLYYSTG